MTTRSFAIHAEPYDQVHEVVERSRRRLEELAPKVSAVLDLEGNRPEVPEPLKLAGRLVPRIFTSWDAVAEALNRAALDAAAALGDQAHTADEQRRRAGQIVQSARAVVEPEQSAMATAVEQLRDGLSAMARPPRPQPEDAAQEGRLAGLKSDLTMLVEGLDGDDLVAELGTALGEYLLAGDELGTWLLASSPWPDQFLRSGQRRQDETLPLGWQQTRSTVLAPHLGDDAATAQQLLAEIESTRGLEGALISMRALVGQAFADLSEWVR